ncbi:MAG: hypothetical protein AAF706_00220 [Bacteroidota bacterium]
MAAQPALSAHNGVDTYDSGSEGSDGYDGGSPTQSAALHTDPQDAQSTVGASTPPKPDATLQASSAGVPSAVQTTAESASTLPKPDATLQASSVSVPSAVQTVAESASSMSEVSSAMPLQPFPTGTPSPAKAAAQQALASMPIPDAELQQTLAQDMHGTPKVVREEASSSPVPAPATPSGPSTQQTAAQSPQMEQINGFLGKWIEVGTSPKVRTSQAFPSKTSARYQRGSNVWNNVKKAFEQKEGPFCPTHMPSGSGITTSLPILDKAMQAMQEIATKYHKKELGEGDFEHAFLTRMSKNLTHPTPDDLTRLLSTVVSAINAVRPAVRDTKHHILPDSKEAAAPFQVHPDRAQKLLEYLDLLEEFLGNVEVLPAATY